MSSSSKLCSDAEEEEEVELREVLDVCESYVSDVVEDISACWVVLGVGKWTLDSTFVNVEKTKAFRAKPHGAAGDCRCQFAALNLIHNVSEVRVV
jgi:hypothetical protein